MELPLETCLDLHSTIHELTSSNVLKPFLKCMLHCTHFLHCIVQLVLELVYHGQCGPIDHGTHVPGLVAQSSAEIEYNAECTAGMDLAHFIMLVHELLNEDPDMFPKEAPLIVLDSKSSCNMSGMFGIPTILSHAHGRFDIQDNQRNFLWKHVWIFIQ